MNFKHGKFANLASKTHGSVSPEAPTSVATKDTPTEAPTNTTNTVSSSITLLTYVSTTVSSSADPSLSFIDLTIHSYDWFNIWRTKDQTKANKAWCSIQSWSDSKERRGCYHIWVNKYLQEP